MAQTNIMQLLKDKMNEYDAGHITERQNADGSVELVNQLDELTNKKKEEARYEENNMRQYNYSINIAVLGLVLVIVMLVMVMFWINVSPSFTGIYYDKNGNRRELYHNKSLGSFDIKTDHESKSGMIKKINSNVYGLYIDNMLVAYLNNNDKTVTWQNDIWIADI